MKLWVVGRIKVYPGWEIQGVYDTEKLAVDSCRDESYFVGPMTLNEDLPHESVEWEGSYFPRAL